MLLVISLLLPFLSGFFLVLAAWKNAFRKGPPVALSGFLSAGLLFGFASVTFYGGLLLAKWVGWDVRAGEGILGLAFCLGAFYLASRNGGIQKELGKEVREPKAPRWIGLCLLVAAALVATSYIFTALRHPYGFTDAWMTWDFRARCLYRLGPNWQKAFSPHFFWTHLDYPLLVPLNIARGWTYLGRETQWLPISFNAAVLAGIAGLLGTSLAWLQTRKRGYLAVLFFLAGPQVVVVAASQYADLALAYYYLAALCLIAISERQETGSRGLLLLAGLFAGLAAWTKNEGILFLLCLLLARGLASLGRKPAGELAKDLLAIAFGAAPALALVIYFKTSVALPNDLVARADAGAMLQKLLDPFRYLTVGEEFAVNVFRVGGPVMLLVPFLFRKHVGRNTGSQNIPCLTAVLALGFVLAGYFFVYVLTPFDLSYHLETSSERLFFHLWPGFALVCFYATGEGRNGVSEKRKPRKAGRPHGRG